MIRCVWGKCYVGSVMIRCIWEKGYVDSDVIDLFYN